MYSLDYILSLKNQNKDNVECLLEFINNYEKIVKEDTSKPIFSQTNKYDLFPKKKPYKKFRKNKNVWTPTLPKTDLERVKRTIKSILNKITEKNYNILIETLVCEINKFNIVEILDILVDETISKITYDISFHDIYIKICHRIWSMKTWNEDLISIVEDDEGKLFWAKNSLKINEELHGPYETENQIREEININFKYYLLDALENKFRNKMEYFKNSREQDLSEEDRNKWRKKVFSLVQFLGKMYLKSYLSKKILYVIILDLIKYNQDEQPIEEYIETFSKLWLIIDGKQMSIIPKEHIYEIFLHISNLLKKYKWTIRIEFMIEDMINKYNEKNKDKIIIIKEKIENNVKNVEDNIENIYDDIENIIMGYKKKEKIDDILKKLVKYKKHKLIILDIIMQWAIEDVKNTKRSIELINKCDYINILDIQNVLNNIIDNINEIMLDIPKVKQNLLTFLTNYDNKELAKFVLLFDDN